MSGQFDSLGLEAGNAVAVLIPINRGAEDRRIMEVRKSRILSTILLILAVVFALLSNVMANGMYDVTLPGDIVVGVPDDGDWPASQRPEMAIDDNVNTKYLHFKGDFNPDVGPTGLRVTPSAGSTIVTGLRFSTANDYPGRDPVSFELYGSNGTIDGPYTLIASGDILDFRGVGAWPRLTKNSTPITFSNNADYEHYQLLFTAIRSPVGGAVNSMQIAEVELLGPKSGSLKTISPHPANGSICANVWLNLSWVPGYLAVLHKVYFSSDWSDVAQRKSSALIATIDSTSTWVGLPGFAFADGLPAGSTYYWCVDEINDVHPDSPWKGDVWSFSIPTGPAGWWNEDIGTTGGSTVQKNNSYEITANGEDIWGITDGFHFMSKVLLGDGSITARVVSNGTGSNKWAKGGVMIRDDLSLGSAHAMTVITGGAGGGAAFHWRGSPNAATNSAHNPKPTVSPPYWIRIDRIGNAFSGFLSSDGRNWRQQGTTQIINMTNPIYIGLCVTSHDAGTLRTYTFDNVSHEGNVIGRPLNLVASQPLPANSTLCTNNWSILSWMPGELAALHHVYFSADSHAVTQRDTSALIAVTDATSTPVGLPESAFPDALRMGTTYYWCVDEVNDVETDGPWYGDVWSFRVPDEPAVYLLITNERLAPAFEPLVQRRTEQGFDGRLLTVETIYASYTGEDEPERIRNCIGDHYDRYGTQYVALGGDQAVVPVRWCDPRSNGYYMPADLYYADMDGSDWDLNRNGIYGEVGEVTEIELTPEVHLGRIPLRTSEDAVAYTNKVVTYELASPDGFANSMLLTGHWGFASGNGRRMDMQDHDPADGAERWQLSYIYYNFIQRYWQAVPLHFLWDGYSSWDTEVCGDYELTPDHLSEELNKGYHFVFFWGHGNALEWSMGRRGRFNTVHTSALTNTIPSIVASWSCGSALFDNDGTCLSEAFLQNPHGGAVVYLGFSRSSNSYPHFCTFYQSLFKERPISISEAMTLCKAALATNGVGDPYHQYAFVLHGDPCIQLLWGEHDKHLQLFKPKGCEVIECGTDLDIRWNAAGTGFASGEKVKLEYSPNGGNTWYPIAGAQSLSHNEGFFRWRDCPLPAGQHYRIRVVSLSDPSVKDMSGRDFTIGDLALLTVQSTPVEGVSIDLSGSETAHFYKPTDFNITIPRGASVNVSAPEVVGDSSEIVFMRWMDESGNTIATTTDSTFILTQDKTIVAEYAGQ